MRARAGVGLCAAAAAIVAATAGCDWREFDDLQKQTLVASIAPPSDYDVSDDFGRIIVALTPPADGSAAARFVTTATRQTAVGVMTLDASGQASGTTASGTALTNLANDPVLALAEVPGTQQMLLGAPGDQLGDVLLMSLTPPYAVSSFRRIGEDDFGIGVAAGNIGGAAAPEFAVTSIDTLHVYVDSQPDDSAHFEITPAAGAPCQIALSANLTARARINRGLIVWPLLASGTQIAVGTPVTSGGGHVSIYNVDVATGVFTCALELTQSEALFGQSMVLGDFDGDGTKELLVGAPPNRVYMYRLPLTATPTAMVSSRGTGIAFGASLAAFNLDGNPGDEALIGDPDADVGGALGAGNAQVFTGATLSSPLPASVPAILTAFESKAGAAYGSAAAGLRFCPGAGASACVNLALVGASSRALSYFTVGHADPRVK